MMAVSIALVVVDKSRPYSPLDSYVKKKTECVSHVTRQMASNFRRHLKEFKGKKLEGFGGEGRLAVARIDAIQNFYGHTICDANKEDV